MPKATLTFRIEQDEIDKLNEIAIDERLTLSDIARRAVYEFIQREGFPQCCDAPEIVERDHGLDRGTCTSRITRHCENCGKELE